MNTPSESADPQPDSPSFAEASTEANDPADKRKGPLRIGTQRYGVAPPKAVPHPVLPLPPEALVAKAAAYSVDEPATADASSTEQGAAPPAKRADAPDKQRRESKPKAPRPINEVAPRKYPPPNTRGQLPPELEMEYLEALGGQSLEELITTSGAAPAAELEPDSRHKAKVVATHRDSVFVDVGGQQGVVPLRVFADPPEPGAVIDVVVSRFNAAEGFYEFTVAGAAVDVGDWSEVAEGMVVEARVTGHNKGGLECEVSRLRGFIPASQISMYRVEDLAEFVDQKFACLVTEVDPDRRKLVLSRRAILEREKAEAKEKLMASLAVGQVHEGTVRSLQSFGAFVDIGGVDGLIHISQLSWDRIKHASEALEVGQKVKVKIQKIDPQTGKLSFAFRDLSENPWANAARDFPARTTARGTVSRLMEFGAFVRLAPGVEGLVHISELSHKRIFRVSDVLTEGQQVDVMVLSVDPEAQRISLSLKALEAKAPSPGEKTGQEEAAEEEAPPPKVTKTRTTPLKGGVGGPSTGEKFGLKW